VPDGCSSLEDVTMVLRRIPGQTYYDAHGEPFVEPEGPLVVAEQEWVSANETEQIAAAVNVRLAAGWTLRSVTFGTRYWHPPGAGQLPHSEDGWLLLFLKLGTNQTPAG
jgi:hypothetical protein